MGLEQVEIQIISKLCKKLQRHSPLQSFQNYDYFLSIIHTLLSNFSFLVHEFPLSDRQTQAFFHLSLVACYIKGTNNIL